MNSKNNLLGTCLIIETATTNDIEPAKIISENKHTGRVLAEGTLQEANMKNRNGRFYEDKELFPELVAPRQLELLRTGNMRGENGHPLSKDIVRQQTIDPNNCSVIYTKFWTEGPFVKGRFFGTFNDKGEEFDRELRNGFKPSFSLRALGTIVNTGRGAEVKGTKLITYDRVIYPSHDKAYTDGIVSEAAALTSAGAKIILPSNDPGMVIPVGKDLIVAQNYIKSESANFKTVTESFDFFNYDDMKLINGASQVQLSDNTGTTLTINLEQYIHNEIMEECLKHF